MANLVFAAKQKLDLLHLARQTKYRQTVVSHLL